MSNFMRGLACFGVGAVAWLMARNADVNHQLWAGRHDPVLVTVALVGFGIMVLGPVIFWVLVPLFSRAPRPRPRHEDERPPGPPLSY